MVKKCTFLYLILLAFLPAFETSSYSDYKSENGLKCEKFTFYEHLLFNKTTYLVVNGVKSSRFGEIYVLNNKLTLTPNPSSKVTGNNQATVTTTSFDGKSRVTLTNFAPFLKNGKRGIISAQGVVIANIGKASPLAVIGATKDFSGVEGNVTVTLLFSNKYIETYKVDFLLCAPS